MCTLPRHCHTSNIDRTRHPILPCLHGRDSTMPPTLRKCHASGIEIVPCLRYRECNASAVKTCRRDSAAMPPLSRLTCLHHPACRTSAAQPPMPLLSTHGMPPPPSMVCLRRPASHASAA
ncbi:hypothetical protein L211DRAFT_840941 [Terfezia boudieri ATCC MYA-4762]|uniref:Uncharacterized protein n=1 Tax=Terfezia boudieri ATCC MYA-4762 TaxID=1051890 RepID=A0A3N4LKL4_9PEZI|nr:hypothetical protein L211DRAFT_840941 [Terfezia boudieri ATCC MYA-4762]